MKKKTLVLCIIGIFALLVVISVVNALMSNQDTATASPTTAHVVTPVVAHAHKLASPTPVPTPTIQQVVDNSWQYNCCGLNNDLASVEAAYDPSTGQASVYVVATAFMQSPVDVGKAFIYQYEAAIWESSYKPVSVIVTVVYQGSPTGAISATVLQETATSIDWKSSNPYDAWNVYDTTNISSSLNS